MGTIKMASRCVDERPDVLALLNQVFHNMSIALQVVLKEGWKEGVLGRREKIALLQDVRFGTVGE